jgi:glyoxylase-like metal-dependent hydrolase (beta-lactamase superfamily II)
VRALSLHADVIVLTSRIWQTNCTVVRGPREAAGGDGVLPGDQAPAPPSPIEVLTAEDRTPVEAFVIDSPVLPDELEMLPAVLEQTGFTLSGLLATHGDWDHLLGRLAFPGAALGVAETTAARLHGQPGEAQRELRGFDERNYVQRDGTLTLGSVQALPVPGHCGIGAGELELHPADGHTEDGMAVWIGWAGVLVAGDYLSAIEIPFIGEGGGSITAYLATLERLRPLLEQAQHVVPGHGPIVESSSALKLLEEDRAYLRDLAERGAHAELPPGRRTKFQRELHAQNVACLH